MIFNVAYRILQKLYCMLDINGQAIPQFRAMAQYLRAY